MEEYVSKGYARKLKNQRAAGTGKRTGYLSRFGVYNPNKPEKIRLVFDAAVETEGVPLNSALLNGPDLSQSLMKFRKNKFGV